MTEGVDQPAPVPPPEPPVASASPMDAVLKGFTRPVLRGLPTPLIARLLGFLCLLILFIVWFIVTRGAISEERMIPSTILPSPAEVAGSVKSLFTERDLLQSIIASLRRVLIGFSYAIAIGVPLGILSGAFPGFRAFFAPLELFGRNIPVAALIPLTLVWFGIDELQKEMFIFIASVPFVYYDAATAISSVPERYVETAATLGAKPWQIIFKVLVPLALPDIYNSLRMLFGLAFGYIMLAEIINAEFGLGALLIDSQKRAMHEHIYLILVIITILAFSIDRLLAWFQRGFFPYREVPE
ncbi:MAG: ABC transporter permease [bacterium]